jgi:hypothetical protein
MKKILFLMAILLATTNLAYAVAIDDEITPQTCARNNPACAQFLETTSLGQIKWGGLIAGGLRSLTNLFVDGKLGVGTLRPSTGEQVLKVDVEGAIGAKFYCDENGNHCVAGDSLGNGGTTGDSLWAISTQNTANIYNRNSGNVGIGTNNPTSVLEVKQNSVTDAENNQYVAKFTDAWGLSSFIGINGNGAEFNGNQGVYAHSIKEDGVGITALSAGTGETYGGRMIGTKTGLLAKGSIGLYATDLNHNNPAVNSGARDNKIPTSLLNSNEQYAGYFDGKVNINGDLNINGDVTVNGQPISNGTQSGSYKIGDHCGIFTYGAGDGFDTNIPCAGTYLFKDWQKPGVPSDDDGMGIRSNWQCPAKFTLAGGDYQNSGSNRYMIACVRSAQ